jgi:hypothetical protein
MCARPGAGCSSVTPHHLARPRLRRGLPPHCARLSNCAMMYRHCTGTIFVRTWVGCRSTSKLVQAAGGGQLQYADSRWEQLQQFHPAVHRFIKVRVCLLSTTRTRWHPLRYKPVPEQSRIVGCLLALSFVFLAAVLLFFGVYYGAYNLHCSSE